MTHDSFIVLTVIYLKYHRLGLIFLTHFIPVLGDSYWCEPEKNLNLYFKAFAVNS